MERDEIRARLSDEFEQVLSLQRLTCVIQPIVDLHTYEAIGYELLSRGPVESELHLPDALFEVARSNGRVTELDRLCRMTASRAGATLPPDSLRFVNTEPVTMLLHAQGDTFVREFVEAPPERLRGRTVIEITENNVIDDFDRMREIVQQLRANGFRVAVDDAGAGHSGLQTMVEIEPDFIKLDMSLIRGLESSLVKQKLVRTLHDFCTDADIGLIAEGVEALPQLDALRRLGVSLGQGFLFGRPCAPEPLCAAYPPLEAATVL
ncbi:MAG: EAL domain-containing protein [Thermoleophilia bacterium]|nr:EAL domain-containing protein [Thermoleophilia bacterium]